MSSNPRVGAKNRINNDPADELRRRARRRLVGAVVLFLLALVVVPALIQPGPEIPADPIELVIPERPPAEASRASSSEKPKVSSPLFDEPVEQVPNNTQPNQATSVAKPIDKLADKKPALAEKPANSKPASSSEKSVEKKSPSSEKTPTRAVGQGAGSVDPGGSNDPNDPIGRFAEETMGQKNLARAQAQSQAETQSELSREPSLEPSPNKTKYWVQVAAVADNNRARALRDQLANKGFGARVEATQTAGSTVYRVRVGPFANASKADEAKTSLSKLGFEGRVVH